MPSRTTPEAAPTMLLHVRHLRSSDTDHLILLIGCLHAETNFARDLLCQIEPIHRIICRPAPDTAAVAVAVSGDEPRAIRSSLAALSPPYLFPVAGCEGDRNWECAGGRAVTVFA